MYLEIVKTLRIFYAKSVSINDLWRQTTNWKDGLKTMMLWSVLLVESEYILPKYQFYYGLSIMFVMG